MIGMVVLLFPLFGIQTLLSLKRSKYMGVLMPLITMIIMSIAINVETSTLYEIHLSNGEHLVYKNESIYERKVQELIEGDYKFSSDIISGANQVRKSILLAIGIFSIIIELFIYLVCRKNLKNNLDNYKFRKEDI